MRPELYCPTDSVNRLSLAVFLNRLGDSLFPLTCAAGQVMKWDGIQWACANDALGGGGGGTVTSVLAGTGLQGSPNPITGAGSINLAPAYQLPQACTNGQVPQSNGVGSWTCWNPTAGGTVTSVTAGAGLTGGTITASGTIAVNTTAIQARVTGTCAAGSSIRTINVDGTVVCETDDTGGGAAAGAFVNGGNIFATGQAVLGTLDAVPLQIFVRGSEVMRFEPGVAPYPDSPGIVGGGGQNSAGWSGGTVSGGGRGGSDCDDSLTGTPTASCANVASGDYSTVGGGLANSADTASTTGGGESNAAFGSRSTVAGGYRNRAGGLQATVAGGRQNTAEEDFAAIAGGRENNAVSYAQVGGGFQNDASGPYSVIGGGSTNRTDLTNGAFATIAGGAANVGAGLYSAIGGGENNSASGDHATIPGGKQNSAAGAYSFASGFGANAAHAGSHVFADGQQSAGLVSSTGPNQFVVGAGGGVYLMNNRERTVGCSIVSGNLTCTGTIGAPSDRALKTGVTAVASQDILDRVAALPIATWEYKTAPGVRHVGPMAQDFHAAFGLGDSDRIIGVVDASGVALAAIQGLNVKVEEQHAALLARDARLDAQARRIAELEGHLVAAEALQIEVEALRATRDDVATLRAAVAELLRERAGGVTRARLAPTAP